MIDQRQQLIGLRLPGILVKDDPIRRYKDKSRPCANSIRTPNVKVRVMHDGMHYAIASQRRPDVVGFVLRSKLWTVDTDYHDFFGKGLLNAPQARHDMEAINATKRPEIEYHKFPAQAFKAQWFRYIEPSKVAGGEFWCTQGKGLRFPMPLVIERAK